MFDEREKKTPNGPGSGSSCACAKASGLGTRYSQPLTHAGTNSARRCLTCPMGRAAAAAAAAQNLLAWARGIPSRSGMQVLTALLDFPNGPGSGSSCDCAKASGLGTRYSQPLTHAGTNGARRCLTSQIGRDGVRSACCGPSRQWRQAGRRTRLRGRQLGGVQKRRAAPCAATATQGAAHRLLLGGRGGSGRRRTSAKEGPTDPLLFFRFLCPLAPPVPDRPVIAPTRRAAVRRSAAGSATQQPSARARVGCRIDSSSDPFPSPMPAPSALSAMPAPCRKGRGWQAVKTGGDVAQGRQGAGWLARRWPC